MQMTIFDEKSDPQLETMLTIARGRYVREKFTGTTSEDINKAYLMVSLLETVLEVRTLKRRIPEPGDIRVQPSPKNQSTSIKPEHSGVYLLLEFFFSFRHGIHGIFGALLIGIIFAMADPLSGVSSFIIGLLIGLIISTLGTYIFKRHEESRNASE